MTGSTLPERLRDARLAPVVVVYLGVCWFVLQLVATLRDLLARPLGHWRATGHSSR